MYLKKYVFTLAAVFSFVVSGFTAESTLLKAGTQAPTFSLPALDGDRVSLRMYCGDTLLKPHLIGQKHIVILSFWATYCLPCQKEIPELIKFQQKHVSDSVKVLCVSIDKEGASIVAPFITEKQYAIPVLLDPYRKTAERYGVTALPSLFVIDQSGKIRYSSVGYDTSVALDQKLEQIISDIRAGHSVSAASGQVSGDMAVVAGGESSGSRGSAKNSDSELKPAVQLSAKQKWDAIVKVECGNTVQSVADSLHVTPDEIRAWFTELKKAARSIWEPGEKQGN